MVDAVTPTRTATPTRTRTPTPAPSHAGPNRRAGALVVLIGLLAAFVAVLATPGTTPPLYNGLGFPDEPYRWLEPPPGAPETPEWTPAGGRLEVADGYSTSGSFSSKEQGPQILFFTDPKAFAVPEGATGVDVAARAVPAPGPFPEGTTQVSNVYRFSATPVGASGTLAFDPERKFLLNMRADRATDQVVLLHHWDGSAWVQRATFQVGTEIYAGTVTTLSEYVLLRMTPGAAISVQHSEPSPIPVTPSGSASGSPAPSDGSGSAGEQPGVVPGAVPTGTSTGAVWWVVAVVSALLAGGLVVLRLVLRRRGEDGPSGKHPEPNDTR